MVLAYGAYWSFFSYAAKCCKVSATRQKFRVGRLSCQGGRVSSSPRSTTEHMGTSSSTEELGLRPEDWLEAGLAGDAPSDVGDVSEYELVD